jgi:AbrB family looped-hinge helix DNA binding protein
MAMTLKVDGFGRVVLPKRVRDRLGLKTGSELELSESGDNILLKLVSRQPVLTPENGLLVHRGKLPSGHSWENLVDDDRESRGSELSGR